MSVLIRGLAMPKKCEECWFWSVEAENGCYIEKAYVLRRNGEDKPSWCPLIELSDHGDLIDRDALNVTDSWEWIRHDAPVVIPAERSEDGET